MKKKKYIIVITGANSGIGLATANYLLERGHVVYGIDKCVDNTHFPIYACDITDSGSAGDVLKDIFQKEGRIDVLINNAGFGISGAIEYSDPSEVSKIFDVNVVALINMCKHVAPYMRQNKFGRIINISSVACEIPIPFQACYSATKAAVLSFSMAFRQEVEDFGIKVSAVLPGDTKTGFTAARLKNGVVDDDVYGERITKSIAKMEKDEQGGMKPVSVSKVIYKLINCKNPAPMKTVGFSYKTIMFLSKILPKRTMLWIVKKIYG